MNKLSLSCKQPEQSVCSRGPPEDTCRGE